MSELIRSNTNRLEELYACAQIVVKKGSIKEEYQTYQDLLRSVTPWETMHILDRLLQSDIPFETIKAQTGKLLNLFHDSLKKIKWEKPEPDHLLSGLMLENEAVRALLNQLKVELKQKALYDSERKNRVSTLLKSIGLYESHYIKKENILFPLLEQTFPAYRCLQLMWSFHDDFRRSIKRLQQLVREEAPIEQIYPEFGRLYFVVLPIIFREESIVFPIAMQSIPPAAWQELRLQADELGWVYIKRPMASTLRSLPTAQTNDRVNLGSGNLLPEQIILMLEHLPVDITYVDENDRVCYFSATPDRIFPRTHAIIGRLVQNCHPKESVHQVEAILDAFKSGTRKTAEFWIQLRGRFIHIRYFALTSDNGTYRGCIEVSQDVTNIRALHGEQRLLNWK